MLPLDTSVRATYADGHILDETEQNDVSAYDGKHNTFYDILNKLPEPDHGPMVMFTVFWHDRRYDVDWREMPDSARPIRFRHGNLSMDVATGEQKQWWSGVDFGYQYTDENGEYVKDVQELR